MNLKNKVVIITGGASGIGKEISLSFAKAEAKVVINYNQSETQALALVEEIQAIGGQATALKANISTFEGAKRLVDHAVQTFGHLDILVNNAGITDDTLLLRMTEDQFDRVIETNLKGVFNMAKHALRPIMKSSQGRIINISSISGITGNVGQINYSASKAGVIGLTKTLAREVASKQVTVNAVAPGFIETKMTQTLSKEIKAAFLNNIPLKRFGKAEEIAHVCLFLASDQASYITGQTIIVDGGMIM